MSRFALRTAVATALLALALPGAAADTPASFPVTITESGFAPARLEVPAGVKLKLALKNERRSPVEFESAELRVEKVLAPGASSFVVLHALKPGSYPFEDEFHPEAGKLLVIAK